MKIHHLNELPLTSADPHMPEVKPPLKIETMCKVDAFPLMHVVTVYNVNKKGVNI